MNRHIEVTNIHTGTKFLVPIEYFVVIRPSALASQMDDKVPKETTLQSIFNPMVTYLIKETYEEVFSRVSEKERSS